MKKSILLLALFLFITNIFMFCSNSGAAEKPGYEIILTSGEVIQAFDLKIRGGWINLATKPGCICDGNYVIYPSSQVIKITSK